MDIFEQTPDSLSLDLVKQHLYVDFNEDDPLIQAYMNASLNASELYLNRGVLYTYYNNTPNEISETVFIDGNEYYALHIKWRPQDVYVQLGGGVFKHLFKDEFTYDAGNSKLYIPAIYDVVEGIDASYGIENNDTSNLDVARMMLVGNWYAYRESDSALNLKKVPTGVEFLLDSLEGSVL